MYTILNYEDSIANYNIRHYSWLLSKSKLHPMMLTEPRVLGIYLNQTLLSYWNLSSKTVAASAHVRNFCVKIFCCPSKFCSTKFLIWKFAKWTYSVYDIKCRLRPHPFEPQMFHPCKSKMPHLSHNCPIPISMRPLWNTCTSIRCRKCDSDHIHWSVHNKHW